MSKAMQRIFLAVFSATLGAIAYSLIISNLADGIDSQIDDFTNTLNPATETSDITWSE